MHSMHDRTNVWPPNFLKEIDLHVKINYIACLSIQNVGQVGIENFRILALKISGNESTEYLTASVPVYS